MIDERLPRYQQLRDEIAQTIAQGVWQAGELLPTEAEFAKGHQIAVGTVRRAIDALVADGLVERQQGRGTFVRRPRFDASLFRFFRYGQPNGQTVPGSRLLQREAVADTPPEVLAALQLAPGVQTIRLQRLRLDNETPFLREEIWLPHARFEKLLTASESEIGDLLYPAYERLCGELVARVEETLTIETADAESARILGGEVGAPLVVIDRLARNFSGKPVEWRHSRGSATNFRYKVEIS